MKRALKILGAVLLLLVAAAAAGAWYMLTPKAENNPLPASLVALETAEGQALLTRSVRADHEALSPHFAPQIYTSYCGVASSVAALGTLGIEVDQSGFFIAPAAAVQSRFGTLFGGMTLQTLAGLLSAHGVDADARHADAFDVAALRALLTDNMARPSDVVLVNYDRAGLDQPSGGHISPVVAFDAESDRALVMDTAAHRFPPVWASLDALHGAMNTVDPASGLRRGLVVVAPRSGDE